MDECGGLENRYPFGDRRFESSSLRHTRKTIAFRSLGCKLNQYEIQALREGFLKHGFREVPFASPADYYVLNTCTVTEWADKEAKQLIRACHQTNPQGQILVTGCYATASPKEIQALPGVRLVADNRSKNQILFQVTGLQEVSEEESPFFKDGISWFEERSKAFVKIQDGCSYFCAFCKIPYVRGRLISRNESSILEETERLVRCGYQEIVLSGVCLGSYGKDLEGSRRLAGLIRKIIRIPSRFRIRLSSIDPRDTPVELAEIMKESKKLCPHLHLSLQSGDDTILERMKRGYTAGAFEKLVQEIRGRVPSIGLSTDVIVGFPGENDENFKNTQSFLERIAFHRAHVFPYSEREKTKAAVLDGKIPIETIRKREKALKETLAPLTRRYLESFIGKTLEVLVESKRTKDGLLQGFSENYIRCIFQGTETLKGTLQRVEAKEIMGEKLVCNLLTT